MKKLLIKILSLALSLLMVLPFIACKEPEEAHQCLIFGEIENSKNYEVVLKDYCQHSEIVIPSTYNNRTVVSVKKGAFWECTEITSLTIPRTIKTVEEQSFSFCTNLKSLTIPYSITTWGKEAFACCGMEELIFETGLKEIGPYAFQYCTNLTEVSFPSSVKKLGAGAFVGCSSLNKVTIGRGVTEIGGNAFAYCETLYEIYYQGNVADWEKISLGVAWNLLVPALYVVCADGIVNI